MMLVLRDDAKREYFGPASGFRHVLGVLNELLLEQRKMPGS